MSLSCSLYFTLQLKTLLPSLETGVYAITDPCAGNNTFNFGKMHVRCNMETDCGGWIVIQRRDASLGTVNFTRSWEDYENGFGDLDGEFWIGLKNMHKFTTEHEVDLQISAWNNAETITWNYTEFRVAGPENKYKLTVGGGSGDGTYDAFEYNNEQYFTTFDYDNSGNNCGYKAQGGWWYVYDFCTDINLNGRHNLPGLHDYRLFWYSDKGFQIYTNSEMKIRRKTCSHTC